MLAWRRLGWSGSACLQHLKTSGQECPLHTGQRISQRPGELPPAPPPAASRMKGATHRTVYLPAGCDWYNYWTNERLHGGQTIVADAPIDTLPLFVRSGSIVPLGSEVESTQQTQTIASVRVYP